MLKDNHDDYKKFLISLVGIFIVIFGVTLNLLWWDDFVRLLKGGVGIILALAGLLILYTVKSK